MKAETLAFARKVQAVVRKIPKGKTMTYGAVAKAAGKPRAARLVGSIMSHNDDKTVPCHRVVRADKKRSGYNGLQGVSREAILEKERREVAKAKN